MFTPAIPTSSFWQTAESASLSMGAAGYLPTTPGIR
jgi:hypothetical protein